jgi:ABC-type molybdenum transport system ATPase subunit/photorepair protein PhrA
MSNYKASERVNEAVKAGEDKTEIERLAKLDEVAYMRARKEAAQKLGDLNKLVNDNRKAFVTDSNGAGKAAAEEKTKQADALIELAESAKLFHTPDGVAYADIEVKGRRETWPHLADWRGKSE